jgi:hypothetical protein
MISSSSKELAVNASDAFPKERKWKISASAAGGKRKSLTISKR